MKESNFSITPIIFLICVCLFGGIFYISVLGENNIATLLAKQFVEDVKNRNYSNIQSFYLEKNGGANDNIDNVIKYHFAFELAMLDYFDLLEEEDYEITIERENLWVPFFKTDDLELNILLSHKETSKNIFKRVPKNNVAPLKGLFVYGRKSGHWKLKRINIDSSPIQKSFDKYFSSIDLNKYISTSKDGLTIQAKNINFAELALFEKRILALNLQKALEITRKANK